MMKKILTLVFSYLGIFALAQNQADIGKIQLVISFPESQYSKYDEDLLAKIDGKLTQLLANNGIVSTNYNNGLILEPHLIINGNNGVEGGMQNINVTNITLQLLIKQDKTNLIFSSLSKELKGTGRTENLAINNAVNSISSNDSALINFLEKGKEKLQNYYQNNCSKIMNDANNLSKQGQFEESLALILSIPESSSCYSTAQNKSVEIYKNYQKKNCAAIIKEANASIATKDYSSAFESLLAIDSSSPCSSQSNTLIKNIDSKITAEEKKQWDAQMKIYNDAVSLEKHRINAIKDIAVSYYKSQQRPNHTIIIK